MEMVMASLVNRYAVVGGGANARDFPSDLDLRFNHHNQHNQHTVTVTV
jgi:hypothetical protein